MEKIFIGGIMNIAQCVNSPGGSILRSVEYPTLFPLCLLLTLFASHFVSTLFPLCFHFVSTLFPLAAHFVCFSLAAHFVCFSLSLLPIYTPMSWLLVPDFIQFPFPWKVI